MKKKTLKIKKIKKLKKIKKNKKNKKIKSKLKLKYGKIKKPGQGNNKNKDTKT